MEAIRRTAHKTADGAQFVVGGHVDLTTITAAGAERRGFTPGRMRSAAGRPFAEGPQRHADVPPATSGGGASRNKGRAA